ncbi:bifunctional proline dehydrogenase/L-glutamate gamma-semialdehyde dehydrogenase PutA [Polycladidibacter hongkongensis]|uniref:bifunctional proline dehydrogenase/L-glutamate gamma-semialdehyde dehydrogenase PutA n=1 Tax=Polycladidibacter hongkongensis TaxID=1647556 RepID=UPI000833490C|nr:bifunctional proline dehydrogenase/L-glutamate gamma-semialdehyde dehydrogenase PutA [Pseudovibrio hongkongensis]
MSTAPLTQLREKIREHYITDETKVLKALAASLPWQEDRALATKEATIALVEDLRQSTSPTLMESFLAEYGLSTQEGIALMCLAEALLRVPDTTTIDELISDKIAPSSWGEHLGHSPSSLVNASSWALFLTGKLLAPEQQGLGNTLRGMMKRLGEPVLRTAVAQAMKELGRQFVLGRTIEEAQKNARIEEDKGFTYSYDMLGEAARTEADAARYHLAYSDAIGAIAKNAKAEDIRSNAGISVKLSALHPRYEYTHKKQVMEELVPRTLALMTLAKSSNIGFNIDAEEADRLDLSLDVIEALLANPALDGWDGFGVVVQAYGPRASFVVEWLYELARKHNRRIMVRLVKGAYWDSEIKRAQTLGLEGYPVFTRKANTDISYLACATKLLAMTDHIYPQFATHNAQSVAAILQLAEDLPKTSFEFQRLHGMGEALHEKARARFGTQCRIYAPVGAHKDLLAYLVRRLLENGANSSFVHQMRDPAVTPAEIAADPLQNLAQRADNLANTHINAPSKLYGEDRANAKGWDLSNPPARAAYEAALSATANKTWQAKPLLGCEASATFAAATPVINPADPGDQVGTVAEATSDTVTAAMQCAQENAAAWVATSPRERANLLVKIAHALEADADTLFAILTREAGKTHMDAIGELREAVDFAHYYAEQLLLNEKNGTLGTPLGVSLCISPWNFPLAIFTGQIFAALAVGNVVLAKPAPQTPLVAHRAVEIMRAAGLPDYAVQLLLGGAEVGAALTALAGLGSVSFTGSTATAQRINRAMAQNASPAAPLIAETGGLNAMIVDSTALPEQAVRDIIASSFQSAGQRCSALRMLYVQEDIYDSFLTMLKGAMDALQLGNPLKLSTDVGPVIDKASQTKILAHIKHWEKQGKLLKTLPAPIEGSFCPPALIALDGIHQLEEEIFGPVLHIAKFKSSELQKAIDAINGKGFGLTFGLHTRLNGRIRQIENSIHAGNIYINRNQIGAIVGSQPFGGEGLSGTGPKAGGPSYLHALMRSKQAEFSQEQAEAPLTGEKLSGARLRQMLADLNAAQWQKNEERFAALANALPASKGLIENINAMRAEVMPGPTGETNTLSIAPRGLTLCAGPTPEHLEQQAAAALAAGNPVALLAQGAEALAAKLKDLGAPVVAIPCCITEIDVESLPHLAAIAYFSDNATAQQLRKSLASRDGAILPLITDAGQPWRYVQERHVCVDTTAAGGNASLIAAAAD